MNEDELEKLLKKPVSDLEPDADLPARIRRAAMQQMASRKPAAAERSFPWIGVGAVALAGLAVISAASSLLAPPAKPFEIPVVIAHAQPADIVSQSLNAVALINDANRAARFVIEQLPLMGNGGDGGGR